MIESVLVWVPRHWKPGRTLLRALGEIHRARWSVSSFTGALSLRYNQTNHSHMSLFLSLIHWHYTQLTLSLGCWDGSSVSGPWQLDLSRPGFLGRFPDLSCWVTRRKPREGSCGSTRTPSSLRSETFQGTLVDSVTEPSWSVWLTLPWGGHSGSSSFLIMVAHLPWLIDLTALGISPRWSNSANVVMNRDALRKWLPLMVPPIYPSRISRSCPLSMFPYLTHPGREPNLISYWWHTVYVIKTETEF